MDFQHWPETSGFLDYLKKTEPTFKDVGSTPFEVLDRAGSLALRKYSAIGTKKGSPVLLLPSIINRSFVLDLLPEKSFVRNFLLHGRDVYMIDWGVPQRHEQHLSLETLMTLYLDYLLKRVEQDCDGQKLHLMGHCLGGTLALMISNIMPERFLSLTMITAPVSFQNNDKLSLWARSPDFDLTAFIEAYGNVPWFLMQSAFLALKPTQITSKLRQYSLKIKDSKFLRNFWAMEAWSNDNVNVRGDCFKVLLSELYRKNLLAQNLMKIGDKFIDLRQQVTPTFVLIAGADHIVPETSHLSTKMIPLVKNFVSATADGGHVGALIGGRSQKLVWPRLTEWIKTCEV